MKNLPADQRSKLLRKSLTDIIRGYSTLEWDNSFLYIKHINHSDVQDTEEYYTEQYNKAKLRGLPTEEERLKELICLEFWSEKQEKRIEFLRNRLDGILKLRKKLITNQDINQNKQDEAEVRRELDELLGDRGELFRATCENYAGRQQNNYYLMKSLYRDKNFNDLFFDSKEFDELENNELNLLFVLSNEKLDLFSDDNLKWLAFAGFFQNLFSLSDNIYQFYGKPIVTLSFYQVNLALLATNYKTMLSNSEQSPPDSIKDDPEAFETWFYRSQNVKEVKERMGEGANIIGEAQDFKDLGQKDSGNGHVLDISAMIKQGLTNKQDILNSLK